MSESGPIATEPVAVVRTEKHPPDAPKSPLASPALSASPLASPVSSPLHRLQSPPLIYRAHLNRARKSGSMRRTDDDEDSGSEVEVLFRGNDVLGRETDLSGIDNPHVRKGIELVEKAFASQELMDAAEGKVGISPSMVASMMERGCIELLQAKRDCSGTKDEAVVMEIVDKYIKHLEARSRFMKENAQRNKRRGSSVVTTMEDEGIDVSTYLVAMEETVRNNEDINDFVEKTVRIYEEERERRRPREEINQLHQRAEIRLTEDDDEDDDDREETGEGGIVRRRNRDQSTDEEREGTSTTDGDEEEEEEEEETEEQEEEEEESTSETETGEEEEEEEEEEEHNAAKATSVDRTTSERDKTMNNNNKWKEKSMEKVHKMVGEVSGGITVIKRWAEVKKTAVKDKRSERKRRKAAIPRNRSLSDGDNHRRSLERDEEGEGDEISREEPEDVEETSVNNNANNIHTTKANEEKGRFRNALGKAWKSPRDKMVKMKKKQQQHQSHKRSKHADDAPRDDKTIRRSQSELDNNPEGPTKKRGISRKKYVPSLSSERLNKFKNRLTVKSNNPNNKQEKKVPPNGGESEDIKNERDDNDHDDRTNATNDNKPKKKENKTKTKEKEKLMRYVKKLRRHSMHGTSPRHSTTIDENTNDDDNTNEGDDDAVARTKKGRSATATLASSTPGFVSVEDESSSFSSADDDDDRDDKAEEQQHHKDSEEEEDEEEVDAKPPSQRSGSISNSEGREHLRCDEGAW